MSDHQWENAIRIAEYLEDRLSPSEEEAFMRALGEDEGLRRQYEEELVIRGRMNGVRELSPDVGAGVRDGWEVPDEGGVGVGQGLLQPADEHWQMVTEILERDREAGKGGRREGARIALFGRSGMVAAALLVIISGTLLYIRIGQRRVEEGSVKGVTGGGAGPGGTQGNVVEGRGKLVADSVYARYYRPYSSEDDPVEVSLYYQDYKRGSYGKVLSAKEEDYQVMGVDKREKVVKGYMHLYKGLSYLATGKGREAIAELEAAAADSRQGNALYDAAQWYRALAWLKRTDAGGGSAGDGDDGAAVIKASAIAHQIANTPSRYRHQAEELIRTLGQ